MKKTRKYISGLMSAVMALSLPCTAIPMTASAAKSETIVSVPQKTAASQEEVIGDFAPVLEYDSSPMHIGETREVRISSPFVSDIRVAGITETSENLSCAFDKNSDTFTITALAEGNAKAYIMGKGCAFGSYLHIEILPETVTTNTSAPLISQETTTTETISEPEQTAEIVSGIDFESMGYFYNVGDKLNIEDWTFTLRRFNGTQAGTKTTIDGKEMKSFKYADYSDYFTIDTSSVDMNKAGIYYISIQAKSDSHKTAEFEDVDGKKHLVYLDGDIYRTFVKVSNNDNSTIFTYSEKLEGVPTGSGSIMVYGSDGSDLEVSVEDKSIATVSEITDSTYAKYISVIYFDILKIGETKITITSADGSRIEVPIYVKELEDPAYTTTTTAKTTFGTTTTTAVFDYATMLEYDNSPMKVGETRKVRVYNPHLSNMKVNSIYESTNNISCSYDKNSDTVTITALAEGNAKAYIIGSGCAFGSYLNIEILPESATETTPIIMTTCLPATATTTTASTVVTTETAAGGDANCDGKVNMGDVVLIMQSIANPDKYGLNGTNATHITSQGTLNGDMDGNGITNNDALAIQKKLLGLT